MIEYRLIDYLEKVATLILFCLFLSSCQFSDDGNDVCVKIVYSFASINSVTLNNTMTSHPVFIDLSLDEQVIIFNCIKCALQPPSDKSEVMLWLCAKTNCKYINNI